MRATALGIVAGLLLGVSATVFYYGVGVAMLSCWRSEQSAMCARNYVLTGVAEAGLAAGLLIAIAALWWARRLRLSRARP